MNEILVGVDDSELSMSALDWAADEAHRRRAALRIVHAVAPWPMHRHAHPNLAEIPQWLLSDGQKVVDRGLTRARARLPGLEATGAVVVGPPAKTLVGAAEGVIMTVIGTHRADRLGGVRLGSVAWQVAAHAPCPVVVVRGDDDMASHGEIVVGVDGSAASTAALGFAYEEAALRGVRLRALLAWTLPMPMGAGVMEPAAVYDPVFVAAEEERTIGEALAGWPEKFPEVEMVREVVNDTAAQALTSASARADLVVVGSRGRGGFTGLVLGSVGHALLHRTHCPVAVVRPRTG